MEPIEKNHVEELDFEQVEDEIPVKVNGELSIEKNEELTCLHELLLEESLDSKIIFDIGLKKRTATFILSLIEKTPQEKKSIQETSYIITGFMQYSFRDELDEALEIASELELPEGQIDGDVFEIFDRMKEIVTKYCAK